MGYLDGSLFGKCLRPLYLFQAPPFLLAQLFKVRFYLEGFLSQFLFVFLFALLEGLLILSSSAGFNPVPSATSILSSSPPLLPQSFLTGLITPILFLPFRKGIFLLFPQYGTE